MDNALLRTTQKGKTKRSNTEEGLAQALVRASAVVPRASCGPKTPYPFRPAAMMTAGLPPSPPSLEGKSSVNKQAGRWLRSHNHFLRPHPPKTTNRQALVASPRLQLHHEDGLLLRCHEPYSHPYPRHPHHRDRRLGSAHHRLGPKRRAMAAAMVPVSQGMHHTRRRRRLPRPPQPEGNQEGQAAPRRARPLLQGPVPL